MEPVAYWDVEIEISTLPTGEYFVDMSYSPSEVRSQPAIAQAAEIIIGRHRPINLAAV